MAHVFISYVRENASQVDRLCEALREAGVKVWLDRHEIRPGSRWQPAIRKAIQDGAFFVACFSKEYRTRESSYMNEELALAVEELRKRHPDRAWFIPLLLSDCEIPDREIGGGETLKDIQWVNLAESWDDGVRRLVDTIQPRRQEGWGGAESHQGAITPPSRQDKGDVRPPLESAHVSTPVKGPGVLSYPLIAWSARIVLVVSVVGLCVYAYRYLTAISPPGARVETRYRLDTRAPSGLVARVPEKALYDRGETVTVRAVPSAGYCFTGWSGDLAGSKNPAMLTMDGNRTVIANFARNGSPTPRNKDGDKSVTATFLADTYTLSISAVNGSVTRDPDKPSYMRGEIVTLYALPDKGYRFAGWGGDLSGSSNPAMLIMDGNKSVTAGSVADAGDSGTDP